MIKEAIAKIVDKKDLTVEEASGTMKEIMEGGATPSQIASFVTALRMKGESIEEITGCAAAMREKAVKITIDAGARTVADTCGTGGDRSGTFNVSTAAAFIVAGEGFLVAKHGNRSVTSSCGSADVMAALGVDIEMRPERVKECVEKIGIGFLFAPLFHTAMKHAAPTRKEIGIRTIFNMLGPLTNPACPSVQLVGVYSPSMTETVARVLKNMGAKSAMVVHGEDGLDEISTSGSTKITRLKNGAINSYSVDPADLGLKKARAGELKGGNAAENAEIIRSILFGRESAKRDIALLNAAGLFVAAGYAKDFKEGLEKAGQSVDSGRALKKLESLIEFSGKKHDA